MARIHTHPCGTCKAPIECEGDYARNYDGFPEVICTSYHKPWGGVAELLCEPCHVAAEAEAEAEAIEDAEAVEVETVGEGVRERLA
jgi:hypothetical protein